MFLYSFHVFSVFWAVNRQSGTAFCVGGRGMAKWHLLVCGVVAALGLSSGSCLAQNNPCASAEKTLAIGNGFIDGTTLQGMKDMVLGHYVMGITDAFEM